MIPHFITQSVLDAATYDKKFQALKGSKGAGMCLAIFASSFSSSSYSSPSSVGVSSASSPLPAAASTGGSQPAATSTGGSQPAGTKMIVKYEDLDFGQTEVQLDVRGSVAVSHAQEGILDGGYIHERVVTLTHSCGSSYCGLQHFSIVSICLPHHHQLALSFASSHTAHRLCIPVSYHSLSTAPPTFGWENSKLVHLPMGRHSSRWVGCNECRQGGADCPGPVLMG